MSVTTQFTLTLALLVTKPLYSFFSTCISITKGEMIARLKLGLQLKLPPSTSPKEIDRYKYYSERNYNKEAASAIDIHRIQRLGNRSGTAAAS